MKYINFFILIMITFIGCGDDDIPPVVDQTYTLSGKVVDSSTDKLLEGVTVGIKSPEIQDSLVFLGDSLNRKHLIDIIALSFTDETGQYRLDWFLGSRNTALYDHFFAYKPGYKLWLYKDEQTEIRQTGAYIDELDIKLKSK